MPLAVPELALPGGPAGPVEEGRPVLDPLHSLACWPYSDGTDLLVDKLLLVAGLPGVDSLAVLHTVTVLALLGVPSSLGRGVTLESRIENEK